MSATAPAIQFPYWASCVLVVTNATVCFAAVCAALVGVLQLTQGILAAGVLAGVLCRGHGGADAESPGCGGRLPAQQAQ